MRATLTLLTIALAFIGAEGCGGTSATTGSSSSATAASATVPQPRPGVEQDHDGDTDGEQSNNPYDSDDGIRFSGRAASAPVERTIESIVGRYYAGIATNDGAQACSLLDQSMLSGYVDQSCAATLPATFEKAFGRTPSELTAVKVTSVRVDGDKALAFLRLATSEVRLIPLEREGGVWKLNGLLDIAIT